MNGAVLIINHFAPPQVRCSCCGWEGRLFRYKDIGQWVLPQMECPVCGLHDRHRMLRLALNRRFGTDGLNGALVLHCAPEPSTRDWLCALGARCVVSSDLDPSLYPEAPPPKAAADLTQLPFRTGAFDLLVCIHVLEHIPDDRAAIAEICRVLRPGGTAILMVPLVRMPVTHEYDRPNPQLFDHVRDYAVQDFPQRLSAFTVQAMAPGDVLSMEEQAMYRIRADEIVYFCHKAP